MNNELILIVDDELSMRQFLEILLKKEGYTVETAENGNVAIEKATKRKYAVILMDYNMPEGVDGIELLSKFRQLCPGTQVVVITAYASTEQAIKAIELGALDYVSKPFNVAEIKDIVKRSIHEYQMKIPAKSSVKQADSSQFEPKKTVSRSKKMHNVIHFSQQVAPTESTVLITGESGVGKEIIAQYIHDHSARKKGPWFPFNCGAIPENLQESELFGYEKGAFTGADKRKIGYFEAAKGGTLFLDEVGELSENMQVKLLRVLQEKRFMRVGGVEKIHTDVRLIAATNKDLQILIEKGRFREDLFFRLNVFELHIPPLRERREDILSLAQIFLDEFTRKLSKKVVFSDDVKSFFLKYHFPGNVRELQNIIERGIVLAQDNVITMDEIKVRKSQKEKISAINVSCPVNLDDILAGIERKYIKAALKKTEWNRHDTAVLLGITERSLRYRMDKLNVKEDNDA